jgi:hypothetical protein
VTLESKGVIIGRQTVETEGETTYAYMDDRTIRLGQELDRAEEGFTVQMVQDVTLADLPEGRGLTLRIERGCLGETLVAVANIESGKPDLLAQIAADTCEEPTYLTVDPDVPMKPEVPPYGLIVR